MFLDIAKKLDTSCSCFIDADAELLCRYKFHVLKASGPSSKGKRVDGVAAKATGQTQLSELSTAASSKDTRND